MSNQIVISSGAKVRELEGVLTGTAGIVNALGINVANGIPQLDGSGKILVSQLPNSVMEYKGTWNAATNTPTLANGTGNQGDVYLCNVAGTVDFGAGPIVFFVGDQVIYSGTIWQRASGASGTVTSVAVTETGDALSITGSPITTSGTINIGFAGTSGQYVNGAGGLTTFPSLTGFVPYTGATANVDLGTFDLTADVITGGTGSFASSGGSDTFAINHSSGSGIALNITKGGNGEGIYINKTSGSGNAATIIGTLNATTLVKSGGTSSQFLMADGSVNTSVLPSGAYLPLTGGTLTGALNGTSALFSSSITSNLSLLINRFSNGDYLALKIENRPITNGNNGSGFIAFYSNSGDATSDTYTTGKIYGKFDTNSYNSARLTLATVTGNEIYQDVLTAKDTNVGIGTINPAQTLHLFTTSGTGSGVGTAIQIQSAGTGADQGWVGVNKGTGNGLTLSVQTNNIIFNTGASTPFGGTERLRITNGGDVGIGIISPLYKLDVDGTGRFSNTLYIGSSTGFISDAMLVAQINTPPSSDRYFAVNNNGAYGLVMGYTTTSGRARIANISNSPMTLETNNIVALTLAANQTATFASSVTATSLIKTGGTSSQFLMADGSVNTSVLPSGAYLPLAGGTLTGSLSGTSATFSSTVTANSLIKTGGTSAQILAADGSVITAGTNITISGGTISSTGAITGSGTTNYVTKFTGASSIGNSLIFDNGTNVGIGQISPSYKLDVQDNGVSGIVDVASFSVTGNGGSGRGVGILIGAAGSSNSVQVARLVGYQELANPVAVASSFAIQVANSSGTLTERLRITQAGNLLIGSTTDNGSRLQVTGAATFSSSVTANTGAYGAVGGFVVNYSGASASSRSWRMITEQAVFGDFDIQQSTTQAGSTYASRMYFSPSGNVGIGTNSPQGRLHVYENGVGVYTILRINNDNSAANFHIGVGGSGVANGSLQNNAFLWNVGSSALILGTADTERMRITSGGNVLINKTSNTTASISTTGTLQVNNEIMATGSLGGIFWESRSGGVTSNSNWYGWYASTGTIYLYNGSANIAVISGTNGLYTSISDINKKKDFEVSTIGLDAILGLKPTLYRMKSDDTEGNKELGFIAQEVKEFIPQAYVESEDFIGLNYNAITAGNTKAIQELYQLVLEQQEMINELKALIAAK